MHSCGRLSPLPCASAELKYVNVAGRAHEMKLLNAIVDAVPGPHRVCRCMRVHVGLCASCSSGIRHQLEAETWQGGVEKKFAPGKNFRGGLGSWALPAKKKLSQYFHSIWNFFCKV